MGNNVEFGDTYLVLLGKHALERVLSLRTYAMSVYYVGTHPTLTDHTGSCQTHLTSRNFTASRKHAIDRGTQSDKSPPVAASHAILGQG